jgi:hypothetical protein
MGGGTGRAVDPVAQPTTLVGGTSSMVVASQYSTLLGWTAAVPSAALPSYATFRFHNLPSTGGASQLLTSTIIVAPSQNVSQWYGPRGIATPSQLFLERVGGISEIVTYGY